MLTGSLGFSSATAIAFGLVMSVFAVVGLVFIAVDHAAGYAFIVFAALGSTFLTLALGAAKAAVDTIKGGLEELAGQPSNPISLERNASL